MRLFLFAVALTALFTVDVKAGFCFLTFLRGRIDQSNFSGLELIRDWDDELAHWQTLNTPSTQE